MHACCRHHQCVRLIVHRAVPGALPRFTPYPASLPSSSRLVAQSYEPAAASGGAPEPPEAVAAAARAEAAQQTFRQLGRRGDWLHGLSTVAARLWRYLALLRAWLQSCVEALPQISSISPQQAVYRMALVLGASLLLIVIVSTIDGILLQLYLLGARRVA